MKIGILAYVLRPDYKGGVKTYLCNIIKELEKIDKENEYFLYVPCDVELPFSNNLRWHIRICKGLINRSGTLWQLFNAIKYLLRDKIDIFWATENLLPTSSFRKLGIKTVLTVHDVISYVYPEKLDSVNFIFFKLFGKKTIKNADWIMVDSVATKDKLKALYGNFIKEVEVIYAGVDAKVFRTFDKNECREYCNRRFNISKKYILSVSVLKPSKNIEGLLKAFRIFKDKYKHDLQLVIVGSPLCGYSNILKIFRSLHFEDNDVKFLGFVDREDLVKLYNGATIFITLPIDEGFGLPVLEAITCGIPVICSDIPALREVAESIATFVDYNNYGIIADHIEKIYIKKDIIDYSKIDKIAQRFSWSKAAERIREVFDRINN